MSESLTSESLTSDNQTAADARDFEELIGFWLGTFGEDRTAEIEDWALAGEDRTELLEAARDELIIRKLNNRLTTVQSESYAKYFLENPYHQELEAETVNLRQISREHLRGKSWLAQIAAVLFANGENQRVFGWKPIAAGFAGLMIIAGIAGFVIWFANGDSTEIAESNTKQQIENVNARGGNQTSPPTNSNAAEQSSNVKPTTSPKPISGVKPSPTAAPKINPSQTSKTANPVLAFALSINQKSGGAARSSDLLLNKQTKAVDFTFAAPAEQFPKYVFVIKKIGGGEIWREETAQPQTAKRVAASKFESGDYVFEVRGAAADGTEKLLKPYPFRVRQ